MKVVVVFAGLLIAAAFVAGWMISDQHWANPPREEAEAEQIRIEGRGAEELERIELDAYQRQKDIEVRAAQERARLALRWQDCWNALGMGLIITTAVGLLTIAGIRIAVPVAADAYGQYADCRARLVAQQTKFEEARAVRMLEERQLLEIRPQRTGVTLTQDQDKALIRCDDTQDSQACGPEGALGR